ncbi:MAG: LLM class flavin-dependent oxidoreductase [Pseudomonadota bacterium]
MKFGLWYSFRNPEQWRIPYVDLYRQHLEQIEWAETIGYDDVWLTEHHFCDDGHAPSILPLAAAVAVRTQRIRIGTSVLLLPLHHAVRVAEDVATIDILSGGRFELGVGVGYRPQEFSGLDFNPADRASLTDEGLAIITRLLDGETLDFKGKNYVIEGAKLEPPAVQRPRPPLWVGGFAAAAARRTAQYADGYIGTGDMVEQVKLVESAWAKAGREGKPRLAGGHFWLIVAKDPERTFEAVAPHVLYQIQIYNQWLADAGQALFPPCPDIAALRDLGVLQVLPPSAAVDLIGSYIESTGIERYYNWTVPPGYAVEKMNEHLALFAEEVIPQLR